jgi:hypothetical protein
MRCSGNKRLNGLLETGESAVLAGLAEFAGTAE